MNDKVDVLKLMDYMISQDGRLVGLHEARAAVAEMIEAAGSVNDATVEHYGNAMGLHLALAATGGLNERLSAALARVKGE